MGIKKIAEKIIPKFLLSFYHYSLAFFGALHYDFPGKKITVIGVTGTKGKSTSVILIGKILEEAGHKVAWLTSATIKIGEKEELNPYHMTMPGRFVIQKFLENAVEAKCKYAILEVTSEGVKQHRHCFINFDTAVFTNLKPEHIEAHGSFEKYRGCKGGLFRATKKNHVINLDDENADYFLKFSAERTAGFSTTPSLLIEDSKKKIETIFAENLHESRDGIKFSIKNTQFDLNLLGRFNSYNAISAICVGLIYKVSLNTSKKALEKIQSMPGRMEVLKERPFKVIVDLAHTPDSYEEVFKAIKAMPHSKIISVFGSAGGGRDKWKRPVLGKIAAEHSDYVIICNEDPYDESPASILAMIKSGIIGVNFPNNNFFEIVDRRQAIKKGLSLAKENDIVLILGKGTEQLMVLSSGKIPWDDRQVVREELNNLK